MSLHISGTFYVPSGESRTVRFPALREGNDESRVLMWSSRGEVFCPVYVDEADSDALLLLNQYNAGAIVESVKAATKYGDVDPSDGAWRIERTEHDELIVDHQRGPETAADAMGDDDG